MPFPALDAPARSGAFQIVATLGPASITAAERLAEAGASAFRLNASHFDGPGLADVLGRVRAVCPSVPLVVDLQGAKMRTAGSEPIALAAASAIRLSAEPDADVRIPHPELFDQARPGDTISIDDGRVRLAVVRASAGAIDVRVLTGGVVRPRKGVNLEQHPVHLSGLTSRDLEAVDAARRNGVATFAFSFMIDGREASWLRSAMPGCRVVGKVERREALDGLDEIAARTDAVWICRGDLGAQLGLGTLAREVAAVDPSRHPVPMLMAGQVLEHMTAHDAPTRSEVCHLFDLVQRGYSGVVLSEETAVGSDPIQVVATAAALLASFRS